jgi:hypothetical protein
LANEAKHLPQRSADRVAKVLESESHVADAALHGFERLVGLVLHLQIDVCHRLGLVLENGEVGRPVCGAGLYHVHGPLGVCRGHLLYRVVDVLLHPTFGADPVAVHVQVELRPRFLRSFGCARPRLMRRLRGTLRLEPVGLLAWALNPDPWSDEARLLRRHVLYDVRLRLGGNPGGPPQEVHDPA